jgi:DNA primase small subunit
VRNPIRLVKQKFTEYYRTNSTRIQPPTDFRRREFGFILFDRGIMVRHQGYLQFDEVRDFLQSTVPSHVYYSAALYERPGETMDKKGWLGTDLMFDIDFDHIPTACKDAHGYWICVHCDHTGTGRRPETCPRCGGSKFKDEAWLCETCLDASKAEMLKLVDFLIGDFGFKLEELDVIFSGHRGYHIHVERGDVRLLSQASRKEIVDYIAGTGLKGEYHGLREGSKSSRVEGPQLDARGWPGRLAKGVYDIVSVTAKDTKGVKGHGKKTAQKVAILDAWDRGLPWNVKGVGIKTWLNLAHSGVKKHAAQIDSVVTTDMRRLIRLPDTLHGKTGLRVLHVPIHSLESFDPLKDAVAFQRGSIRVDVRQAHAFRIGDTTYGPFDRERVELPSAAALYLLCKKAASPI